VYSLQNARELCISSVTGMKKLLAALGEVTDILDGGVLNLSVLHNTLGYAYISGFERLLC
jgi:hypothetical protein